MQRQNAEPEPPATPSAGVPKATPEQQGPSGRAPRQRLPAERRSITHRFSVGGHEGYITVGTYDDGRPGEVFIKMAKEGSTLSGFMDGLALSISIGLQYGVPLKALVNKLIHMRFEPSGVTENATIPYASSVLDYIGRWLGGKFIASDYLRRGGPLREKGVAPSAGEPAWGATKVESAEATQSRATIEDAPSCPTCGMLMLPSGNRYQCVDCGATTGGC